MADNNKDSKQDGGDGSSEFIKLKIQGLDGSKLYFRVKMSTKMGKLKKSYSKRVGVPRTEVRFIFEVRHISDDETPMQLEMENGDAIQMYVARIGGSGMRM